MVGVRVDKTRLTLRISAAEAAQLGIISVGCEYPCQPDITTADISGETLSLGGTMYATFVNEDGGPAFQSLGPEAVEVFGTPLPLQLHPFGRYVFHPGSIFEGDGQRLLWGVATYSGLRYVNMTSSGPQWAAYVLAVVYNDLPPPPVTVGIRLENACGGVLNFDPFINTELIHDFIGIVLSNTP